MPGHTKPAEQLYFVRGLDGSHGGIGPPWQQCKIVEEWRLPYKKLYGPAIRELCEDYVRNNCESLEADSCTPEE
jgi:hypothetical protein